MLNRLYHETLVIAIGSNPSIIIGPQAIALGLIMGSRIDTVGDNQALCDNLYFLYNL